VCLVKQWRHQRHVQQLLQHRQQRHYEDKGTRDGVEQAAKSQDDEKESHQEVKQS